jgi:outer membrane protein assembly factor BamB
MNKAWKIPTLAILVALCGCAGGHTEQAMPLKPQPAFWPTYQHSADRNAVFDQYSVRQDWLYDANARINSGLALAGNTLLFTTFSRKLVAVDVRDGHELWHANVPNIAMSTPIVAENTVYIGTGSNANLERGLRTHFSARNVLLRLSYGKKEIWGIPNGDEVAAFDLHSGAPHWVYRTLGEDMPSGVYADGRLIFANGDDHAYALRADTGQRLWSTDLGSIATMASAVLANGAAIVGVCGRGDVVDEAIALNVSTGEIIWRAPYGQCDAAPAYAEGKVFVASATHYASLLMSTRVAALDPRNGKPEWVYRGTLGRLTITSSNEQAIAGTYALGMYFQPEPFTDDIVALDAGTGRVRWRFRTSGPVKMSPVIANGRLYVGDTVGLLYTLDARNGRLLEVRAFKKPFTTSPPIVVGNKLIIANDTSVQALPLSGGSPDHSYLDDILTGEASPRS